MALGLLQLCLMLLWALKTQAQNSTTPGVLRPSSDKFIKKLNFEANKFQGEWKAIGWVQNRFMNASISDTFMLSMIFKLKEDHSYNVTSIGHSDHGCTPRTDTFVPSGLPNQYILKDAQRYQGLQNLTMKVIDTNYNEYAVVFYKAIVNNQEYMECVLYARFMEMDLYHLLVYFLYVTLKMEFPHQEIHYTVQKTGCH
ncbi:PREDICTED: neutrophil gelatinase-associated lipocalin-like [Chinchilla lanigera]|uniref:Neutrophil gelatinase-associated lipocalin-like n=1 Tax=Chinchilla lanigera TaxID=34839 RepID=A0A8C2UIX6_CHILA|nr:PREDICTED: neutrophil gelatinase-associated lipocalin-like [Chinchilla lanigera]XP_005413580.1 PREDICTED: neutrophil gelatinase-associated lipocalin-like [Chinchilla lanigera]